MASVRLFHLILFLFSLSFGHAATITSTSTFTSVASKTVTSISTTTITALATKTLHSTSTTTVTDSKVIHSTSTTTLLSTTTKTSWSTSTVTSMIVKTVKSISTATLLSTYTSTVLSTTTTYPVTTITSSSTALFTTTVSSTEVDTSTITSISFITPDASGACSSPLQLFSNTSIPLNVDNSTATNSVSNTTAVSSLTTSPTASPTLSGVSYSINTAPASCFALPTPLASLTKSTDTTLVDTLSSPLDVYFNADNSTETLGFTYNSTYFVYDFSVPGQTAILLPDGGIAVVSSTGVAMYLADCSASLLVTIDNFAAQAAAAASPGNSSLTRRVILPPSSLVKRSGSTSFTADIKLSDQCGGPDNQSPTVAVGSTPCTPLNSNNGDYQFTCSYPGANSAEGNCENTVNGLTGLVTSGPIGDLTNFGGASYFLSVVLSKVGTGLATGLAADFLAVATAFNTPAVAFAVGGLGLLQLVLANGRAEHMATALCTKMYEAEPLPLTVDDGSGPRTVQTITDANDVSLSLTAQGQGSDPNCITPPSSNSTDSGTSTTTPSPLPSPSHYGMPCPDASCFTYQSCLSAGDMTCFCGQDINGASTCFSTWSCDYWCNLDSDCGPGFTCLIRSCCIVPVCVPLCQANPVRMKRDEGAAQWPNGTQLANGVWVNGTLMPNTVL